MTKRKYRFGFEYRLRIIARRINAYGKQYKKSPHDQDIVDRARRSK